MLSVTIGLAVFVPQEATTVIKSPEVLAEENALAMLGPEASFITDAVWIRLMVLAAKVRLGKITKPAWNIKKAMAPRHKSKLEFMIGLARRMRLTVLALQLGGVLTQGPRPTLLRVVPVSPKIKARANEQYDGNMFIAAGGLVFSTRNESGRPAARQNPRAAGSSRSNPTWLK